MQASLDQRLAGIDPARDAVRVQAASGFQLDRRCLRLILVLCLEWGLYFAQFIGVHRVAPRFPRVSNGRALGRRTRGLPVMLGRNRARQNLPQCQSVLLKQPRLPLVVSGVTDTRIPVTKAIRGSPLPQTPNLDVYSRGIDCSAGLCKLL